MTKKLDSLSSHTELASRADTHAYAQESRAPRTPLYGDADKSSVASALFGSSGTLERPAISDSTGGRAAIRIVSRGLVGAAAFTLGGHFAKQQMKGYDSWKAVGELKQPLHYVAWGIDHSVGKALRSAAHFLTPGSAEVKAQAAWDITRFRTKMWERPLETPQFVNYRGFDHALHGRSLGSEIVLVTYDFFMASIGDATARNVFQSFDPNVRQPWIVDENGNATTRDRGHFDAAKWGRSLVRSTVRIITKNAGEDWGAALPYVYQMKWQRQAIAKISKGFKLNADNGLNGAISKVSADGTIESGYQGAGALDLHCRFVGYNWYTLMYREGYDKLTRNFKQWKDDGFAVHAPHIGNPITSAVDGIGFSARYVMKSFIKSNLYMQPAVLFFWPIRTPQSKWRGFYVSKDAVTAPDGSPLVNENAILADEPYKAGEKFYDTTSHSFKRALLIHGRTSELADQVGHRTAAFWGNGHVIQRDPLRTGKDYIFNIKHPYEWGTKRNPFEFVLNVFGAASYHAGSGLTHLVDKVTARNGVVEAGALTRLLHPEAAKRGARSLLLERERMLRSFVDASFSYTPYMWAKAETALRVDDRSNTQELGHMDKAIYRLIDSAVAFDGKGLKRAGSDIWQLARHIERDVKSREGGVSAADGALPPRADKTPLTKVETTTIMRGGEPISLSRRDGTPLEGAEKRWAEQMMGRKLDAQVQAPVSATLH